MLVDERRIVGRVRERREAIAAFRKLLTDPDVRKRLAAMGFNIESRFE